MAENSKIEWTDATWNPIAGCDVVSPGCTNCYAMRRVAPRLAANPATPHYHGTVMKTKAGYVWTGKIGIASDKVLTRPLQWKKPKNIFVNSTSDLFHPKVPVEVVDRCFAVMALCRHHTFQVLTKRPERMRQYLESIDDNEGGRQTGFRSTMVEGAAQAIYYDRTGDDPAEWLAVGLPLSNVLLGVSVEDQIRADQRRDDLKSISDDGWKTFVSYEPALGLVNWHGWDFLDWLICGGESGPGARPMHPSWALSAWYYSLLHNIPFMFKQWGAWLPSSDGLNFEQGKQWASEFGNIKTEHHSSGRTFALVGKKRAGRLLNGVEHNGFPVVQS